MRAATGIAADGDHAEYDVPQCAAGTPASECTHTISGTWMPVPHGAAKKQRLVAVHAHCHAPTCIRVEMWNNDTGKLICRQEPIYGGAARDNRSSSLGSNFSEPGYLSPTLRTPPSLCVSEYCTTREQNHGVTHGVSHWYLLVPGFVIRAYRHTGACAINPTF